MSWEQVDLELWTITFSGLAKPHCLVCSSPCHCQTNCPSTDRSRQQPQNGPFRSLQLTHVGHTGPHKPRVSHNLISGSVFSLGCVTGPLCPLPCPIYNAILGAVPEKHSSERRTIYHLFHPKGDSTNNHTLEDPYALQYLWVDDVIHTLKSLGPALFIVKTDSNQPFSYPEPPIGTYRY